MAASKWTPERRQAASEAAKARATTQHEARLAGSVATLDPPEAKTTQEPDSSNVMAQLASLFTQAASDRAGRDQAITEALDVIGRLDPLKYPEIAENPTVQAFVEQVQTQRLQAADVPPGTIIGTGLAAKKKPWTKGDLLKGKGMPIEEARTKGFIEWIEYRPMKNLDVTWQGIRIVWQARRLGYFPKSHVDVFEQSLDADEWNEQHAMWLFNNPDAVIHRDYFTTSGPRVKAMDESRGDYYKPGAGAISMAPSPDLVDNAEEGAA